MVVRQWKTQATERLRCTISNPTQARYALAKAIERVRGNTFSVRGYVITIQQVVRAAATSPSKVSAPATGVSRLISMAPSRWLRKQEQQSYQFSLRYYASPILASHLMVTYRELEIACRTESGDPDKFRCV